MKRFIFCSTMPCKRLSRTNWATNYVIAFPAEISDEQATIEDLKEAFRWLAENITGDFLREVDEDEISALRQKAQDIETASFARSTN
jgi:hypothetical protein